MLRLFLKLAPAMGNAPWNSNRGAESIGNRLRWPQVRTQPEDNRQFSGVAAWINFPATVGGLTLTVRKLTDRSLPDSFGHVRRC
jgi:hypothetical protein